MPSPRLTFASVSLLPLEGSCLLGEDCVLSSPCQISLLDEILGVKILLGLSLSVLFLHSLFCFPVLHYALFSGLWEVQWGSGGDCGQQ